MADGDLPSGGVKLNFQRPKAVVLPASAAVPPANLVQPAPNQFTHTIAVEQPFFYGKVRKDQADGMLAAGAKVVLMRRDGASACHVVDARGLYVVTAFNGLVALA